MEDCDWWVEMNVERIGYGLTEDNSTLFSKLNVERAMTFLILETFGVLNRIRTCRTDRRLWRAF